MNGWRRMWRGCWTGYDAVNTVLALVLFVAAALKAHQLSTEALLAQSALNSRWVLAGVVECELLLSLLLLARVSPRSTWVAALGCFGIFAAVSLHKGLSGDLGCGCFGRVQVNPWWTFLFDVSALLALLVFPPRVSSRAAATPTDMVRCGVVGAFWLLLGVPAAIVMSGPTTATFLSGVSVSADGKTIVLEPRAWVGKPFPLRPYIDVGRMLVQGDWLLLLYRHDCPDCRRVLPKYAQLITRQEEPGETPRVALVEFPPYAGKVDPTPHGVGFAFLHGFLTDTAHWFATTPIEVRLKDGVVLGVRSGVKNVIGTSVDPL